MKTIQIFIGIILLLLTSCATNKKDMDLQENEQIVNEIISVPVVKNENRPLFYNAQKIHSETKNNFIYNIYYGVGGRYIITIQSKNGSFIPYYQSDVSVVVDDVVEPETISFATDEKNNGIFTGFGNNRMGKIKLKMMFSTPETKDNSIINEELTITTYIKDIN